MFTVMVTAQTPQRSSKGPTHNAMDWTHKHVVYSPPTFRQVEGIRRDPRYEHQLYDRITRVLDRTRRDRDKFWRRKTKPESLHRDWGASLGPGATGGDEMYPAKFSFDIFGAPSCANDFVVFNTGVAGGVATTASRTGAFSSINPLAGNTVTIGGVLVLTASSTSNTGTFFLIGTRGITAANLAAAIVRNGASAGVTATSSGRVVTVLALTAGAAGNSIALSTTISPTSFTWGGPTLAGGADAPGSIIAFNNLYSTQNGVTPAGMCGSSGPTVIFSYDTDIGTDGVGTTTGATTTSPVLSLDGTKVAYIESGDSGGAILRILKWDNDTPEIPVGPPDQVLPSGSSWQDCNPVQPNSCLIGLRFANGAQDSESAPFYDYSSDALYVGDDIGKLHKFINVFGIAGPVPREVTTGGWPVTVNPSGTVRLHTPVHDGVSRNIFVGDLSGNIYFVREAGSALGVCSSGSNGGVAPCLGTVDNTPGGPTSITLGGAIDDAPIVDSTTQRVFFFNGAVNSSVCSSSGTNAAVVQLDTRLSSSSLVKVCFPNNGTAGQPTNTKSGSFDNAYFSTEMGSKAGKLYVCARAPNARDHPALFRIGFDSNGVMNSFADPNSTGSGRNYIDLVNASGEECSPVATIFNTVSSTDWLFVSVGDNAALGTTCSATNGGCLMSFNLTALGTTWPPSNATASYNLPLSGAISGDGGSSGIIVDNVADTIANPQTSNIYFTFLADSSSTAPCNGSVTTGCAVKLTQAALQ